MITKEFIRKKNSGKDEKHTGILTERYYDNEDGSRIRYLTFPVFENLDFMDHALSTREGGISTGCYSSMNLSYTMGDDNGSVSENLDRMMRILSTDKSRIVAADQKHTANVRVVTEKDAGKGIVKEFDYSCVDGHITNERGLVLAIYASDCVPLYFADPVNHAIGTSHSGWRGTVKRIGAVTVRAMMREYQTDPEDLICAVGPSVCRDCYEISEQVAEIFMKEFSGHEDDILVDDGMRDVCDPNTGEIRCEHKYHLDLWQANRIILEEAGVRPENIQVTDICTHCNPDLLFSHRRTGRKRGNNAGFIVLK
jgi:YfiH family protein